MLTCELDLEPDIRYYGYLEKDVRSRWSVRNGIGTGSRISGGDTGWIYKPLTSRTPHVVVKKEIVNSRSLPGTRNSIVAKAHKGTVFKTIASVRGWVKVRHERGVTGWVARELVWGW